MSSVRQFLKSAPSDFQLRAQPDPEQPYKFFVRGKGCTLGILFETSVDIHFEWLYENDQLVDYGPEIRYKSWPKQEFTRLVAAGVWDIVGRSEISVES